MNDTFDMDSWEVKNGQFLLEKKRAELKKPVRIARAPQPAALTAEEEKAASLARISSMQKYMLAKVRARQREKGYDSPSPDFGKQVEVKNKFVCPDCKMDVNTTDTHGYKRVYSPHSLLSTYESCPTCTPTVQRSLQREKKRVLMTTLLEVGVFSNINNFPDGTENWTIETYRTRYKANAVLARYIKNNFVTMEDKNIFLHGSTGVGKTGVAIGAGREMAAAGYTVLFIRSSDYVDMCKADNAALRNNSQITNIEKVCKAVEVLILDELGIGAPWETEQLEAIIEYRLTNGLSTLITSNYSLEGLAAYYTTEDRKHTGFNPGDRLISRLKRYATREVKGIDQRTN